MDVRLIAGLLLSPFLIVFVYAMWSELLRWKSEGRAQYGLTYNEETGTTHVTALEEEDAGFDPETFDPDIANEHWEDSGTPDSDDDTDTQTRGT
ncbi:MULTISPECIES: hypothetical protein [Sediminimonas]|uniref:hypothetical protein n=1 Tax=Sediminimonas TaxID=659427 RepID=UPI000416E216|nr:MULTISPECIES: hypothetical protein [Sediminimonas]MDR9484609.1 hypothetical protein [Sediminimonas sp.]